MIISSQRKAILSNEIASESSKESKSSDENVISIELPENSEEENNGEAGFINSSEILPSVPKKKQSFGDENFPLSEEENFIQRIVAASKRYCAKYKIPKPIMIAQAILESDYGRSDLAASNNNYFGIKAKSEKLTEREKELIAGKINKLTSEYKGNKEVKQKDDFNTYKTMEASIEHYCIFLDKRIKGEVVVDKPYPKLANTPVTEYYAWAMILQKSYCTDPKYASKLMNLIKTHELTRFL